jgi:multidrug resistance efflux pump
VDIGNYVKAAQPIMTFVSANDVWIEAEMRENSLGNIGPGDSAEIVLDVAPGRLFKGIVDSIGPGVAVKSSGEPGDLPSLSPPTSWLRDAQRFPVIIRFADQEAAGLRRVGGQADVVVYAGDNPLTNALGWVVIRIASLLSYVY